MNEKFIVLGGLGHIGFNVVKILVNMKKNVKVLINNKKYESKLPKNVEVIYGDITKKDSIDLCIKGNKKDIVYVINCANHYSNVEDKKINLVNVTGNINVIESCIKHNVDKYVYVGSSEAFMEEKSIYGISKSEALESLNNYYDKLNISSAVPSVVIGPHDYKGNIANNYLYNYYLGNLRSFVNTDINIVDVRDVAQGIIDIALYGKPSNKYYISGNKCNTKNMMNEFSKMCNIRKISKFYTLDKLYKKENLMNKYCDFRKIKPYYNKNLLISLGEVTIKLDEDIEFSYRNILETLNDIKLFFDSVKK